MVADQTPDGRAEGRVTLGKPHEGPPGLVHGGVVATLLDHVLARAVRAAGRGGLTATLTVTYRRPVPLGVALLATAELGDRGRTADDGAAPGWSPRTTPGRRSPRPRDCSWRCARSGPPTSSPAPAATSPPGPAGNPVPEPARSGYCPPPQQGGDAMDGGWVAYGPQAGPEPVAEGPLRPELADVGRLARRGLRRSWARRGPTSVRGSSRILADHLGAAVPRRRGGDVAGYDHVNVQAGLDAWLADPGRSFELVGVVELPAPAVRAGRAARPAAARHPWARDPATRPPSTCRAGPDGQVRPCVALRPSIWYRGRPADGGAAARARAGVRHELAYGPGGQHRPGARRRAPPRRSAAASLEHNVFRGQVLSFGQEMFGHGQALLQFHRRPTLDRRRARPAGGDPRRRSSGRSSGSRAHKERLLAGRPAPQARPAALRAAGHRQDAHGPLPDRPSLTDAPSSS